MTHEYGSGQCSHWTLHVNFQEREELRYQHSRNVCVADAAVVRDMAA